MEARIRTAVVAIFSVLVALGVVAVVDDNNDGTPDRIVIPLHLATTERSPAIPETVPVDTADPDNKPDTNLKLTEQAENVAQEYVNNPKDLASTGAVPLSGTGVQKQVGHEPFPLASDELQPCRKRTLPTNFSARGVPLSRVRGFYLHYTAGPDIPNSRADVDGLTAYGSRASSRVSWHINMDKDGNCDYNVPFSLKAWTIANLNPVTINIEVAGRGEPPYLRPGGYRALALIYKQIHAAYPQIPLTLATTDGRCNIIKAGIGTHWQGGPCSGGHSDIKPLAITAVIAELRKYVGDSDILSRPISAKQRAACHRLNVIRRRAKRTGKWTPPGVANKIKARQKKHHLRCRVNKHPHLVRVA